MVWPRLAHLQHSPEGWADLWWQGRASCPGRGLWGLHAPAHRERRLGLGQQAPAVPQGNTPHGAISRAGGSWQCRW